MIVGILSPLINRCGGAEWVALNIIAALKENGHQVIILTDQSLNQSKFSEIFNRRINVDQEIVFPFALFPPADSRNVYTDALRAWLLKLKCDLLIDTYSCAVLPGTNISYIHYPILDNLQNEFSYLRNRIYYFPYRSYLKTFHKNNIKKFFLVNSKFTASATKKIFDVEPYVLYPPVSNEILNSNEIVSTKQRDNSVITIGRISNEKNLNLIPYIAKDVQKNITFRIAGLLDSKEVFDSLLKLTNRLAVSNKVKIFPDITRDRLQQLLLTSKVYLHTKVNEHFGISIIEAMASGCIPIVHDSGGAKEFVPKEFRYKNLEEASEKVEKAIDTWSPERADEISKQANKFSEENFSKSFIGLFNLYCKEYLN